LIANAISHQMLKSQGLPQEGEEETPAPGVFGFSKRLSQLSRPEAEEPPKPKINIT